MRYTVARWRSPPHRRSRVSCAWWCCACSRRLRQQTAGDVTASQISALATIAKHGEVSLGELAAIERIAPPSMTRIAARLEEQGLVERRVDAVRPAGGPGGGVAGGRGAPGRDPHPPGRLSGCPPAGVHPRGAGPPGGGGARCWSGWRLRAADRFGPSRWAGRGGPVGARAAYSRGGSAASAIGRPGPGSPWLIAGEGHKGFQALGIGDRRQREGLG